MTWQSSLKEQQDAPADANEMPMKARFDPRMDSDFSPGDHASLLLGPTFANPSENGVALSASGKRLDTSQPSKHFLDVYPDTASSDGNLGDLGFPEPKVSHQDLVASTNDTAKLEDFTSNWNACRGSVRAYLSSLLSNRNEVEDLLQEVAMIAWKKGPVGQGERAFLGHCLASARLVGLAASRKLGSSRVHFLPPDLALSLADEVMRQEQEDEGPVDRILALRACMARLDDRQRQILSLRYAPEGPYRMDEIARSDGMKPEALYKKLERLRAGLRDCVTQRMKGGGGDV